MLAGAVVTGDHAVKTPDGWQRVRDTGELRRCLWVLYRSVCGIFSIGICFLIRDIVEQ